MANQKKKTNVAKEPTREHLEELIVEYQPRLKSFIQKQVNNKEDAEDILQDVFYQLIKTVNTAMNPIENVSAWLFRVARNTIINAGIKKKEEPMPVYQNNESDGDVVKDFSEILFSGEETNPSPETEYLRSLVWTELESALSELPLEQRELFELTELDGISMKEISETTGVSVNTLLSRKHYAVLHLRKRLKDLYEDIICFQ
ncbi:MAG: sigma-70 family RNA polymerase sigma factor [Tannerella sp.]|jgi:RNA polymerase sigma factor (sigma-70 family)|nr:sigma-70 family RNA polymerase sigma factor [Tannerella sp.]